MPAVASMVRFYVDESAPGLGKTLAAARKDTIHCGHPLIPECQLGTLDPDWTPIVVQRGLVGNVDGGAAAATGNNTGGSSTAQSAAMRAPGQSRTGDLSLRRRLLYPLSYWGGPYTHSCWKPVLARSFCQQAVDVTNRGP